MTDDEYLESINEVVNGILVMSCLDVAVLVFQRKCPSHLITVSKVLERIILFLALLGLGLLGTDGTSSQN